VDRARQVPMATGISILSRLLRCTLHFRNGSMLLFAVRLREPQQEDAKMIYHLFAC
jgi:hypothetical protein